MKTNFFMPVLYQIIKLFLMPAAIIIAVILLFYLVKNDHPVTPVSFMLPEPSVPPTLSPNPLLKSPQAKTLPNTYHIFQSFNNCGPASLSMALSYYGLSVSQEELGQALRPYQNPQGDNDDKSVTLAELSDKAKEYGFIPFHRPNGTIDQIKLFITYDMPVVTRTWLKPDEDIGHYRVVKGYDESRQSLLQDDSYQNKNLWYTYDEFNEIWNAFNYEYLVLVPSGKVHIAQQILGADADELHAWRHAADTSSSILFRSPDDMYARFNLSVAQYHLGEYQNSIDSFEIVYPRLPSRMLWYQIEPIYAYQKLKQYDRALELINRILTNHNRAFSELYQIRGEIYLDQGDTDKARKEFEQAIFYNENFKPAQDSLQALNNPITQY